MGIVRTYELDERLQGAAAKDSYYILQDDQACVASVIYFAIYRRGKVIHLFKHVEWSRAVGSKGWNDDQRYLQCGEMFHFALQRLLTPSLYTCSTRFYHMFWRYSSTNRCRPACIDTRPSAVAIGSPALPPALLRSLDDDWEMFGTRGAHSEEAWWELETDPAVTAVPVESIPAMGNPAVMDRVGGSEVILARRVGPGEAVKGLSLVPVSSG